MNPDLIMCSILRDLLAEDDTSDEAKKILIDKSIIATVSRCPPFELVPMLDFSLRYLSTSQSPTIQGTLRDVVSVYIATFTYDSLTYLTNEKTLYMLTSPEFTNKGQVIFGIRTLFYGWSKIQDSANNQSEIYDIIGDNVLPLLEADCSSSNREDTTYELAKLMLDYPQCVPVSLGNDHLTRICLAFVRNLSGFYIPNVKPTLSISKANAVANCVALIWKENALTNEEITQCVNLMFEQLTEPIDTGGSYASSSGLAAMCPVIPLDVAGEAQVKFFDQTNLSEVQLKTVMLRMIEWLMWPQCQNVDTWIKFFMCTVYQSNNQLLLLPIFKSKVEKITGLMKLPLMRHNACTVVTVMLEQYKEDVNFITAFMKDVPDAIKAIRSACDDKQDLETAKKDKDLLMRLSTSLRDTIEANQANSLPSPAPEFFRNVLDALEAIPFLKSKSTSVPNITTQPKSMTALSSSYISPMSSRKKKPWPNVANNQLTSNGPSFVGLINNGNSCYMNSVLQALYMTDLFRNSMLMGSPAICRTVLVKLQAVFAFLAHSKRRQFNPSEFLAASKPAWFEPCIQHDSSEYLRHLLDTLHEEELKERLPDSLYNKEQTNNRYCSPLSHTVTEPPKPSESMCMDTDCADSNQPVPTSSDEISNKTDQVNSPYRLNGSCAHMNGSCSSDVRDDLSPTPSIETARCNLDSSPPVNVGEVAVVVEKGEVGEGDLKERTAVHRIFGGKAVISYRCMHCQTVSKMEENFLDLNLPVPEKTPNCSIKEMMANLLQIESLSGDNKYDCETCKEHNDAERSIRIVSSPKHLILTLLRFGYKKDTGQRFKLCTNIDIPDNLQLPVGDRVDSYGLYATVVHSGVSMDSGHYYTYAKHSASIIEGGFNVSGDGKRQKVYANDWFEFDDDCVRMFAKNASFNESIKRAGGKSTPYILFYRRLGNGVDVADQMMREAEGMGDDVLELKRTSDLALRHGLMSRVGADNEEMIKV